MSCGMSSPTRIVLGGRRRESAADPDLPETVASRHQAPAASVVVMTVVMVVVVSPMVLVMTMVMMVAMVMMVMMMAMVSMKGKSLAWRDYGHANRESSGGQDCESAEHDDVSMKPVRSRVPVGRPVAAAVRSKMPNYR
jgi:hypothetical protein